jgi:glycosyltransferase involved in cell wall biosynthesis
VRLALAHDYLTQRGGAERVVLALTKIFPDAPLYTSLYNPVQTYDEFRQVDVRVSRLQRVPAFRRDPRLALPALSRAWEALQPQNVDVILASSTGWAHGISASPPAPKIVYCHNPARWIYQTNEYLANPAARRALAAIRPQLKKWDLQAAHSANRYLANSSVVAGRIEAAYGIEAEILHPPVSIDVDGDQVPIPGISPGFWFTIARSRGYKNTDAVIEGTRNLGEPLVVAGCSDDFDDEPHVTSVGIVTDAQLRWLYANARGLVSVSREDFGLTPLEANAFGTPVAVLRAGGFLDSTHEGVSGTFIEHETAGAVHDALSCFPEFDAGRVRAHAAKFSFDAFASRLREVVSEVGAAAGVRDDKDGGSPTDASSPQPSPCGPVRP